MLTRMFVPHCKRMRISRVYKHAIASICPKEQVTSRTCPSVHAPNITQIHAQTVRRTMHVCSIISHQSSRQSAINRPKRAKFFGMQRARLTCAAAGAILCASTQYGMQGFALSGADQKGNRCKSGTTAITVCGKRRQYAIGLFPRRRRPGDEPAMSQETCLAPRGRMPLCGTGFLGGEGSGRVMLCVCTA